MIACDPSLPWTQSQSSSDQQTGHGCYSYVGLYLSKEKFNYHAEVMQKAFICHWINISHFEIVQRSFKSHSQVIHKLFTSHSQVILKSFSSHSKVIYMSLNCFKSYQNCLKVSKILQISFKTNLGVTFYRHYACVPSDTSDEGGGGRQRRDTNFDSLHFSTGFIIIISQMRALICKLCRIGLNPVAKISIRNIGANSVDFKNQDSGTS